MSNPLFSRGKIFFASKRQVRKIHLAMRGNKILFSAIVVLALGVSARQWSDQSTLYAQASTEAENIQEPIKSPLFEQSTIFVGDNSTEGLLLGKFVGDAEVSSTSPSDVLEKKISEIVGDSPIRSMTAFISKRDERVAGFLVGIARKESSWGEHAPSLNGQDCHNYWGYKGTGGRGAGMGYACFASAEEAVRVVGDRIEVLVNKDRNTPARMVNTWKCGTSCAGDPGAPGWVSTVALYFDKIVG